MSNLQFAKDENGNRITSFPKGTGFCPVCDGAMVAKCGEIYRWHWQHVRDRNCDSWKEHETRWHREWKEKFPADCREVIIQHNGEKHIASILTNSGTVIEFQNSSISAGTILTREAFYDDMIWVINAKSFSENLIIKSKVNQKIWRLDRSFELDKKHNYVPDGDLTDYDKKIRGFNYERDLLKDRAENEQRMQRSLENAQEGLDGLIEQVLSSWDSFADMSFYIHGMSSIAAGLKADYSERSRKIRAAKAALEETQKSLASVQNMEPYHHGDIRYVLAEFKDLRPDLIDRCIIISKADKDTMFPTILKFRSEQDFHTYQYKTALYLFAVYPALTLERLNDEIARLQNECQLLTAERPDYKQLLTEKFTEFLQGELKLNEQRYYEAREKQM